jgi:hypothetical protein
VSDLAKVGTRMEFIITKDDSDTKDQIVLLSLRRIAVRPGVPLFAACRPALPRRAALASPPTRR